MPIYAGATRAALGDSGARWPLTPGAPTTRGTLDRDGQLDADLGDARNAASAPWRR